MLRFQWLCWIAFAMTLATTARSAEEFRCDTEIFVAAEKEPVQATLTIFTGAVVYDFLLGKKAEATEITVYDLGRGQLTLLDTRRKLRTTIATDDLLKFTAAFKTVKAESDLFKFCSQPEFAETFAENKLTLASKQLTYRADCLQPEQEGAAHQYRQFADWSARLNGMRPGNLPPFPRLKLNESLVSQGMLPADIERTISTTHFTGRRTETIRSSHRFNWTLSRSDRERRDKVDDLLIEYKPASVEDYLGLMKAIAGK